MIRNTLGYNLLWIVLGLVIAVAFAIMIERAAKTASPPRLTRRMMFFPVLPQSWVVGKLLR